MFHFLFFSLVLPTLSSAPSRGGGQGSLATHAVVQDCVLFYFLIFFCSLCCAFSARYFLPPRGTVGSATPPFGATLLETQGGWTSTPETRSPALLRILLAQASRPPLSSASLSLSRVLPDMRLCPVHLCACPELCLTSDRLCPLLPPACQELCLGMRIRSRLPPDNQ